MNYDHFIDSLILQLQMNFRNQLCLILFITIYKMSTQHTQPQNPQKKQYKITKSFISGGIAGVCAKTLVAPIQRVKYLFITRNRQFSYKSFFLDFRDIVKKNGILNLWRGNTMNILRIFPYSAIDFAVFDYMRGKFYEHNPNKTKLTLFFCGAVAGICSMSATTPIEFIRLRLAMEKENFSYKGNIHAFTKIIKKQGIKGFYRGYGASLTGVIIYHGFSFFIFTTSKQFIRKNYPDKYKKWYIDFALGGLSAFGQVFGYPFDILRKRMQGQLLLLENKQISKIMNYKELIISIFREERGIRGFYKSISLNLIKAPLASATSWTVKNNLNRRLDSSYDF